MATYNSAGSGNFNVDATWTESGHPSTGDTAIINTGHTVTMTADDAVGSIDIQGTLTTDGTARTLTLDANAQGYICEHRGTVSTTINLVINSDFAGDKLIRLNNGGNGNFNDVSITLQSTSRKLTIGTEAASIDGDLTITQGIFDTDSSNNYALTVAGATDVTGTLTLNDSTVSLGALRANSGAAITQGSSGTLELTSNDAGLNAGFGDRYAFKNDDATSDINLAGTMTISNANYSLFGTAPAGASVVQNLVINTGHYWINTLTLGGTLVVNANKHFQTYGSATGGSRAIVVNGDVTLNGKLTAYKPAELDLAATFGSLTINTGGTYRATNGITTITNKNSSNYMFFDAGTFTHNNGTVHFKADTSSGTWYAVKGHSTEDTTEFYNFTTERVGSSVGNYRVCVGGSNQFLTVRNNLTVGANCKIFSGNGSSILRQSGLATLNGELDLDNFTDIEMGAVTINSGGTLEFDNGSITLKAESFRNVGGTINA